MPFHNIWDKFVSDVCNRRKTVACLDVHALFTLNPIFILPAAKNITLYNNIIFEYLVSNIYIVSQLSRKIFFHICT